MLSDHFESAADHFNLLVLTPRSSPMTLRQILLYLSTLER